jgi:ABC-type amino acid transport substrate-binding protein
MLSFLALLIVVNGCASLGSGGSTTKRVEQTGQLRVGMAGDYPPMNVRTADGRLIGLDADLALALANILRVELVLVEKPFGELLDAVRKGEVDVAISGISMTPRRNLDVAFAGPYYVSRKAIMGRPEALVGVGHISDLASRVLTVVALRGSTSQSLVERTLPRSAHRFVDSQSEAVALLLTGLADDPVIRFALLQNPDANLDFVESAYSAEPLGIAISPDDYLFVNLVENFLENLENLGLMDNWREKWFENPAWTKLLP